MKLPSRLRSESAQHAFGVACILILLLLVPMLGDHLGKIGGGIAMLAGSIIALAAYFVLFWERVRGWRLLTITILGAAFAAAAAWGLSTFTSRF